jgi:hypothetical protein
VKDSQLNKIKHLLVSHIEKLETRLLQNNNQINELMNHIAALERTLGRNLVTYQNYNICL